VAVHTTAAAAGAIRCCRRARSPWKPIPHPRSLPPRAERGHRRLGSAYVPADRVSMLARAPGDVICANPAQVKRSPSPGRSPHPAWGNGQCAQLRRQRTRAADSAQISQRRAAGMRCAAGQLTERRAGCAADSAHIWSTWSASMVDLRPGPGRCAEPAGPRPPPAVPFGIAVRPGAPRGQCAVPATPSGDRSRGGRGRPELVRDAPVRSRGWSTTEPHDRYTAAQASGSRVPSVAAWATSVRRRLWLRA
jgi:hypothetical protein